MVLLFGLVLLSQTLDVHPCQQQFKIRKKPIIYHHNETVLHQKNPAVHWNPSNKDAVVWSDWLNKYKKDYKATHSGAAGGGAGGGGGGGGAGAYDYEGMPESWKGDGPGAGGMAPPPPWAVIPGGHGKPDMCFLEPEVGSCSKNFTRWGYNPFTAACTQFHYSGCGGNHNNFRTKGHCVVACAIDVATNCEVFGDDISSNT